MLKHRTLAISSHFPFASELVSDMKPEEWSWAPFGSSQELKNWVDNFLLSNCSSSMNASSTDSPWCELAWKLLHQSITRRMRSFSVEKRVAAHSWHSFQVCGHCDQEELWVAKRLQQKTSEKRFWKALLQLFSHHKVDFLLCIQGYQWMLFQICSIKNFLMPTSQLTLMGILKVLTLPLPGLHSNGSYMPFTIPCASSAHRTSSVWSSVY
jgi:hypothetical protein